MVVVVMETNGVCVEWQFAILIHNTLFLTAKIK